MLAKKENTRFSRALKKKINEEAKKITYALCGDKEGALYENVTVEGQSTLFWQLEKLMLNKDVFGYYFLNTNEQNHDPEVIVFKILRNYFCGLRQNASPASMHFFGSSKGMHLLLEIYPEIHATGVQKKSLTEKFFREVFAKMDIDEIEQAWQMERSKDDIILTLRKQLGLTK